MPPPRLRRPGPRRFGEAPVDLGHHAGHLLQRQDMRRGETVGAASHQQEIAAGTDAEAHMVGTVVTVALVAHVLEHRQIASVIGFDFGLGGDHCTADPGRPPGGEAGQQPLPQPSRAPVGPVPSDILHVAIGVKRRNRRGRQGIEAGDQKGPAQPPGRLGIDFSEDPVQADIDLQPPAEHLPGRGGVPCGIAQAGPQP
jgi:hypothetical protein